MMEPKNTDNTRKHRIPVSGGEPPAAADEASPSPDAGPGASARETPGPEAAETAGEEKLFFEVPADEWDALRARAAESDALEERLKRVAADYANAQKRIGREAQTRIDYAIQDFTREILPVTDSLHRALSSAEESHDLESFIEGIRLVDKQFADILARHGVEPIETRIGEVFDPERHDVLAVQPTDEYPENAVTEVVERGYRLKDRVLRPTKVLVAKPTQAEDT